MNQDSSEEHKDKPRTYIRHLDRYSYPTTTPDDDPLALDADTNAGSDTPITKGKRRQHGGGRSFWNHVRNNYLNYLISIIVLIGGSILIPLYTSVTRIDVRMDNVIQDIGAVKSQVSDIIKRLQNSELQINQHEVELEYLKRDVDRINK